MKQEIYRLDCGRGFEVVLVQTNADEHDVFEYFDVELHYSQCYVITLATKAIGNESGDYWALSTEKIMKKIIFMADSIDMATHNLMCYSRNLLMDSPKDGYADEWHRENNKGKMLRAWMNELLEYWGKDSEKTKKLKEIFAGYIYDFRGMEV